MYVSNVQHPSNGFVKRNQKNVYRKQFESQRCQSSQSKLQPKLKMSDTIENRLENLHDVLAYDSDQQIFGRAACFTTNERICINQERGALLSQMNKENKEPDIRHCQCPPKLESKIRSITQKITDINLITN